MRAIDELVDTLPKGIDEESSDEARVKQTARALSEDFRESVKSIGAPGQSLDEIISGMTVKNVNDLLFDYPVPHIPGARYYSLIEEFLSAPDSFKKELRHITDGYLSIVSDLQKRVLYLQFNGVTDEHDENNRVSTANYLDTRLTSICERTKLVEYVYACMGKLNEDTKTVRYDVSALQEKVTDIDSASDKIMPNIITLLGVFSSIIVVILTLITTSSTWLASASEASVLIAFVIPVAIATLAVCALSAFIRPLINDTSKTGEYYPAGKISIMPILRKWGLWLFVAAATILVVCGTMRFSQKEKDDQIHYIVKCLPTLEAIDSSDDIVVQPTSESIGQEFFITQEVLLPTGDTFLEKIPCAECDKHEDGFVYYCLLHQKFE